MQAIHQITSPMVLIGAYGRSYETKKDAIRDWEQGLDFKIPGGPYCSIRDLDALVDEASGVYVQTKQGYARVS